LVVIAVVAAAASVACAPRRDQAPPDEIVGVVVDVEAEGLGHVTSFDVRSSATAYEIFIDPGTTYGFPPSHLSDHLASSEPVRVGLMERNGRLYATSIEDA
jgi:hypothetical protein